MTSFVEYQNKLSQINAIASTQPEAFVAQTEAAYHQNIKDIAVSIAGQRKNCKIVML